ncbi:MAG: HEAT repeat domain-containing protein [Ignavibacteria bacterium]|nr:HEAT repeat domain-containing protein [Ignavibacteria bacterium]
MEHETYKKQLILYSYNELKKEERNEFERHLLGCGSCKNELEELKRVHHLIKVNLVEELDEDTLFESRQELLAEIRNLKRKKFTFQKIWELFTLPSPTNLKIAYSFAAVVLMLTASYFFYFNKAGNQLSSAGNIASADSKLTNLQFINSNLENGEVEITYEQIVPVKLKGNVNDAEIQKVLAKSLIDNENPGIRLKAVNAIYSEKRSTASGVVKDALIKAMMYDNNPGVRKEAMNALCNIPFDEKISGAMIYVLQNDKNSGLRIQAINCLNEKNDVKRLSGPNIKNVLKNRMQEDDNSYIKLRAKTMLTKLES